MIKKSITIVSEKGDNTKVDERIMTIFKYYIILGTFYAFAWLFEKYATNRFISQDVLNILMLAVFISAILPPLGYLVLKLLRGLKIVQIGDFVKQSKGRLKKLLLKSGLLVAGDSMKINYEQDEYICTFAIPKTNNIDLETVQRNINQFRDAFRKEVSNIYDDYEYFYIEVVVKEYIPSVEDIFKYDIYPDKMLYGFASNRAPLYWDYTKKPHALLCAPTSGGKTTFFNVLFYSMNNGKNIVADLIDGKGTEFVHYADRFNVITDGYLEAIQKHHDLMDKHKLVMKEHKVREYHETGLPTRFLVIDEYASVLDSLSGAEQTEVKKLADNIARLGRTVGVEIIIILQQPHSRFISTELRDNCHFKGILGVASDSMYNMLFDLQTRTLPKVEIGSGYVQLGKDIIRFRFPKYEIDNGKESDNDDEDLKDVA